MKILKKGASWAETPLQTMYITTFKLGKGLNGKHNSLLDNHYPLTITHYPHLFTCEFPFFCTQLFEILLIP